MATKACQPNNEHWNLIKHWFFHWWKKGFLVNLLFCRRSYVGQWNFKYNTYRRIQSFKSIVTDYFGTTVTMQVNLWMWKIKIVPVCLIYRLNTAIIINTVLRTDWEICQCMANTTVDPGRLRLKQVKFY